jgi:predicted nuclease of predicted toxin-antitoxin system
MKFLLDENLPAYYCELFQSLGFECTHVTHHRLTNTPDEVIRQFARQEDFVIVTFDLDFSRLTALDNVIKPSVLTFRTSKMSLDFLRSFLQIHLLELVSFLEKGALVTVNDRKIKIKQLPM